MIALLVAVQAATTLGEVAAAGNNPVSKVVGLLEDMQQQLHKEADEDEEVYEKVTCWCTVNGKDKGTAIAGAEARITSLEAAIEDHSANSARLNTEIKNLAAEVAANEQALATATEMRTKELAEYNTEEKDLLGSIGSLKSAVTVLGKHQSFAQVPEMTMMETMVAVHAVLTKHEDLVDQIVTPTQRAAVQAFVQAAPGMGSSYNPASGQIFGILSQMKETFETNLASSQNEEATAQAAYEEVKAAKQKEIASGNALSERKAQELATTDSDNAQAKQDLEDTQASLTADQAFLLNLKNTCKNTDAEYAERKKMRLEEIVATGEALEILSSDDARSRFSKSFNFLQVGGFLADSRSEAQAVLERAAKTLGSPKLSALAANVRLDAFTKVIGNIDEMVAALTAEKADDVKQKDFCDKSLNENAKAQTLKARDIDEHESNLASLDSRIKQLTRSVKDLTAQVTEMQTQLKRAGEDREIENQDFQHTVEDQRATQSLLNNALKVLEGVYKKKDGGYSALQEPVGPPAPAGFGEYKKAGGAGGVLGMIEQIVGEAKQLETDAINAEADAQKGYETFVKDTNKSLNEKNRAITDQNAEKAQAEQDHTTASTDLEYAEAAQRENEKENSDLHGSCDFTIKNFDVRQEALTQEMEALGQAKSILKGSKFTAFLEKK